MKKFNFRLQKVLNHKIRLFEIAQTQHAEAMQILRREETKLESLKETYKNCLFELAQKTTKNFKVRDLGPYYRYMSFIKKEIAGQTKIVIEAYQEEEKRRHALMQAAKEKEVLSKLRERRYSEYKYTIQQEEQKFLDDITASKYARAIKVKA